MSDVDGFRDAVEVTCEDLDDALREGVKLGRSDVTSCSSDGEHDR